MLTAKQAADQVSRTKAGILKAIKSGKITHIDEEDLRELQALTPENIAALEERLAKLNARLGGG